LLNMDIFYSFVKQQKVQIMNISFTKKQEKYIAEQVESGDYQNNSEVIRDALRLHSIYREKVIQDLKKEIEKGWNGPDSKKSLNEIIASKR
jgi:antitoxin ParD1/3/4